MTDANTSLRACRTEKKMSSLVDGKCETNAKEQTEKAMKTKKTTLA